MIAGLLLDITAAVILQNFDGSTAAVRRLSCVSTAPVPRQYSGSTAPVLGQYGGSTVAVPRQYSDSTFIGFLIQFYPSL
jgi:hypothetical protein